MTNTCHLCSRYLLKRAVNALVNSKLPLYCKQNIAFKKPDHLKFVFSVALTLLQVLQILVLSGRILNLKCLMSLVEAQSQKIQNHFCANPFWLQATTKNLK